MSIAGLFCLFSLIAQAADLNQEIAQKQLESARLERQISDQQAKIEKLEERNEQIKSEIDNQQQLILNLGRSAVEQDIAATQSQNTEDLSLQEYRLNQSVVLSQLKDQITQQQGLVAFLESKVQQNDRINMPSDAFDRDRADLQAQRQRLQDLQYQYQTTLVEVDMDRQRQTAQNVQNIVNRKAASQVLEQQERDAGATYEKLQVDLKSAQDQTDRAQADLQTLENRKLALVNEISDLTHAASNTAK
jgi:hypothetical protein